MLPKTFTIQNIGFCVAKRHSNTFLEVSEVITDLNVAHVCESNLHENVSLYCQ